jgi:hypothetical protein
VTAMRESFDKLTAYVHQPGEGEDWTYDDRDAARAALTQAEAARDRFLRAIGR